MGNTFPGRVAASLLTAIDLPELITYSQVDYENLAIELANNPEKLHRLQKRLMENRLQSALFNSIQFTKNIETAYKIMHDRYQCNLQPDHFSVAEHNP